jgi:hypothetical protein
MAFTITRVELHGATPEDYLVLHAAMSQRSFQRFYDTNGRRYHLPEAEYIRWSIPAEDAVVLAKQAVAETRRTSSIIAMVAASFAQDGLRMEALR